MPRCDFKRNLIQRMHMLHVQCSLKFFRYGDKNWMSYLKYMVQRKRQEKDIKSIMLYKGRFMKYHLIFKLHPLIEKKKKKK